MTTEFYKIKCNSLSMPAIGDAKMDQEARIESDGKGGWRFLDADNRLLGAVTQRHRFSRAIADEGKIFLHGSVYMTVEPCDRLPAGKVHIGAILGDPGETYAPAECRPRSYPEGIVGESFYQDAIARCRAGDVVKLCLEPDNPHDPLAIAVRTMSGEKIGHIARTSWLRDAIHRDGQGVSAFILSMHGDPGMRGVVLRVSLDGTPLEKQPYRARAQPSMVALIIFSLLVVLFAILANAQ